MHPGFRLEKVPQRVSRTASFQPQTLGTHSEQFTFCGLPLLTAFHLQQFYPIILTFDSVITLDTAPFSI